MRRGAALAARAPSAALAVAALAAVVGFALYPTYPNYDSYYSLVWGRELLDGVAPSFDAYRAPTQHPLAVAFGAALSVLGEVGDRVLVGATVASFVVLAAALYRLAAASFTALVGLVAAALLCTRFDFPFLALRAYVDIPYLALVVLAAALEAERPRRGTPVFALLAAAGLLRPEAWLLSGAYFLWTAPRASGRRRVVYAGLVASAPVAWMLVDVAVTGDALFSFRHTSGLAEELGRRQDPGVLPVTTVRILRGLDKAPVLFAAVPGLVLAALLARGTGRRAVRVPFALLVLGLLTFVLLVTSGSSVVYRYLTVPSLMLMIFAAVTVAGWTALPPSDRRRRAWALGAAVVIVYGLLFTLTRLTPSHFITELRFRGDSHAALRALLHDPAVRAARRCGPVSLPNHKLIPEVRWILDAGEDAVVARSDPTVRRRVRRGVAIYATTRKTFLRYGFSPDDIAVALPLRGFTFAKATGMYGAYVRC